MESQEILNVILVVVSLMTVVFSIVLYMSSKQRKSREEERLTRAELSFMRERLERQIYDLNERLYADSNRWKDVNHLLINTLDKSNIQASNQSLNSSFFVDMGIFPEEIKVNRDLIFFLTPFHNDFENEYYVVKKICSDLNLHCTRGDEDFIKGNVLKYILEKIMSSSIVIANLNGRNANVYYELGIAHAIGKPVILITSEANFDQIPFDLQSTKLIIYKNENELTKSLTNSLARTLMETSIK